MRTLLRRVLSAALCLALFVLPVQATWSIVTINLRTGEVGVASATCLENFDLKGGTPVIVIGRGAAAAQSVLDAEATNRRLIFNAFRGGEKTPEEILADLAATDGAHASRQYGIVAFTGDPVTYSGIGAGRARHGVTGQVGEYVYAIQGNLLTGNAVVVAAEQAFRGTDGDMGQRLMAAMQAAREFGGDGRCSCSLTRPTACGAPPDDFEKSAHCGYIVVARHGDTDGVCNRVRGCASGDYYLCFNISGLAAGAGRADPVEQLQNRYDRWRADLVGRPDGQRSRLLGVQSVPADGRTVRTIVLELRDVDGVPLAAGGAKVEVALDSGSSGVTTTGPVLDRGDGSYAFELFAGTELGADRYTITADDGQVRATIAPALEVASVPPAPLHSGFATVSASNPVQVPFQLDVASRPKGIYFLLASLSGTIPGVELGRLHVPLNPDAFTRATLASAGKPRFLSGTAGFLDEDGRGEAFFQLRAGQLLALSGMRMDWVGVVFGRSGPFATNPVGFDILP